MKKSPKSSSKKTSQVTVDSTQRQVDPPMLSSGPLNADKGVELDNDAGTLLSKQLHDLMNHLWAVSARIELAMIDDSCPPEFRKTLAQLGCCAEEAMTIASQARELVSSRIRGT